MRADPETSTSDAHLLTRFVQYGDRAALEAIVHRYIPMVHAAARRQMGGDAHLAEDVTQAVFILLGRKARSIDAGASLAGWLFNTTRFAAANARKIARRRAHHERQAALRAADRTIGDNGGPEELCSHLDDAIAALPPLDRDSVILSYYHGRTYAQVGAAIGVTEEAARKRVSRAVNRMRDFLRNRGLTPASPAAMGSALSAGAVAVPPQFLESTLNLLTLTNPAAGSGVATAIAKGVNHMWMLTKVKVAAALASAAVIGGAVTAQTVLPQQPAAPARPVIYASAAADADTVSLGDGVTLTFQGLCRTRDESWFTLSGKPVPQPAGPFRPLQSQADNEYAAMFRIEGFAYPSVEMKVSGESARINVVDDGPQAQAFRARFNIADDKPAELEILVSTRPWQTVGSTDHRLGDPPNEVHTPNGSFAFTHVTEREGHSLIYVATDYKGDDYTVFAVDNAGNEHFCTLIDGGPVGSFSAIAYVYDVPPDQIASFAVKSRAYNYRATAQDITIDPAAPKASMLKVEPIKQN